MSSLNVPKLEKVEQWSIEDVQAWLTEVDLEDCKDAFRRRMIDGPALLKLSEENLVFWSTDLKIKRRIQISKLVIQIKSNKLGETLPKCDRRNKPVNFHSLPKKLSCDNGEENRLITNRCANKDEPSRKVVTLKPFNGTSCHEDYPLQMSPPITQAPLPPVLALAPVTLTRPKASPPKPPIVPPKPEFLNQNKNGSFSSNEGVKLVNDDSNADLESSNQKNNASVDDNSYEMPNLSSENSGSETSRATGVYEYENAYEAIPDSGYPDSEEYEVPLSPPVPAAIDRIPSELKNDHSAIPPLPATNIPKVPYRHQPSFGYGSLSSCIGDAGPNVAANAHGESIASKTSRPPAPTPPAKRPLPPVPNSENRISKCECEEDNITSQCWFHPVSRSRAEELVRLGVNGTFLVRESKHGGQSNPYTLTLLFDAAVFNINIRYRPDFNFALGSYKPQEPSFPSVESLIDYYQKNTIVLQRASGQVTGKTLLTTTPPR